MFLLYVCVCEGKKHTEFNALNIGEKEREESHVDKYDADTPIILMCNPHAF